LIQGQAWRWIWIAQFLAILLLVPTAVRMCRAHDCGALCSLLLVAAWDFSGAAALLSVCLALLIWLSRDSVGERLRSFWPLAFRCVHRSVFSTWLLAQHWPLVPIAKKRRPVQNRCMLQFIQRLMELRCVGFLVAAVAVCWFYNRDPCSHRYVAPPACSRRASRFFPIPSRRRVTMDPRWKRRIHRLDRGDSAGQQRLGCG
jgi:hypothetical protein